MADIDLTMGSPAGTAPRRPMADVTTATAREAAEQAVTRVVADVFGFRNTVSNNIGPKVAAALLDGPHPPAVLTADLAPLLVIHQSYLANPGDPRCCHCWVPPVDDEDDMPWTSAEWPCPTVAALPPALRPEATDG